MKKDLASIKKELEQIQQRVKNVSNFDVLSQAGEDTDNLKHDLGLIWIEAEKKVELARALYDEAHDLQIYLADECSKPEYEHLL